MVVDHQEVVIIKGELVTLQTYQAQHIKLVVAAEVVLIQDLLLVEMEVQVVQVAVDLEEILLLELVDLQPRVKEMMEEMVLQEHLVVMKLVVAVEVTEQRVLMQVQALVVMVEQEQVLFLVLQ